MSGLLLDTNALLWLLSGDSRLGERATAAFGQASIVTVSDVSLWEIAVKVSVGKLQVPIGWRDALTQLGFERVSITDDSIDRLSTLPLLHRDPFDRMIVAQALAGEAIVLTADSIFAEYGVRVIDARD